MDSITLIIATVILLYAIRVLLQYRSLVQSIDYLRGYRVAFSQHSLFAFAIGRWKGISPGANHFFEDKHSTFNEWDINAMVSAFPSPVASLTVADAEAIKEITSSRARFPKPVYQYGVLSFFGRNIVASEFDEWKKFRKITAPAFSDRNNKLVWDETVNIMNDLFNDVWKDAEKVSVDHCVELTLPITLFVIGIAGFGRKISWKEDDIPSGHKMSFKQSLRIASDEVFFKLFFPERLTGLTTRTTNMDIAFSELRKYMSEMIYERQTSDKVERHDLLSSLIDANGDDLDVDQLSDEELIGNIYIFLLAGHETTAHALSFALGLLALHPDEQEKLLEHIKSVIHDDHNPSYEEMSLLTHSMAVLNEALRMFPPVVNIPKHSIEDTVLTIGNQYGGKRTVPIPKDTVISINTPGLHYNPRYWEDPKAFKPSRFLKEWNKDAFIPFSVGARSCLGKKFAETEGVVILTMLILRYKVTVKEEPQFAGETFEQTQERIFKTRNALTLTPLRVPLTFTRRM